MTDDVDELAWAPATEQARLLRSGQISPVELTRLMLDRIDRYNGALGAFVTVDGDGALAAAKAAEARIGDPDLPPFHGVPISIKDLTDTVGVPTARGISAFRDRVPDTDANVVRKIRAAGFIVLGKTTTPPLGFGCVSEPAGFPPARNPWDLTRTPGGSSGGAGAAVAAGLGAVAHGSDGGGSIRIPSSWCGLFGIKPSRGRISPAPAPSSITATSGPIARSVRDAAALLDAMSGYELGDAFWLPAPVRPFADEVGVDPGSLRIAVSLGGRDDDVAPGNRAALESTISLLESLGHSVEAADPEPAWGRLIEDLMVQALGVGMRDLVDSLPTREDVDWLLAAGAELDRVSADTYAAIDAVIMERARRAAEFFRDYDVLLSPTVAKPPPLIGQHRELGLAGLFRRWESYVPFTTMWNWSGQPAVSVPAGLDEHGLPVGIQVVGRPADEVTLIRLSAQLETARPWAHLRPTLEGAHA